MIRRTHLERPLRMDLRISTRDDVEDLESSDDDSGDDDESDDDDDSPTSSTFSQSKSTSLTTKTTSITTHATQAAPEQTTTVSSVPISSLISSQSFATITISTSSSPTSITATSLESASSEFQSATFITTPVTTSTAAQPQAESPSPSSQDPSHIHNVGRNSSRNAGVIAAATIGSFAVLALILFMFWKYRRGKRQANGNHLTRVGSWMPNNSQTHPDAGRTSTRRSPSSIMNYLMRAAYAAEDGTQYNGKPPDEKISSGFYVNKNDITERLTFPPGAFRHPSVSARTEISNATESTWRTWGASGAMHDLEGRGWTRRFF